MAELAYVTPMDKKVIDRKALCSRAKTTDQGQDNRKLQAGFNTRSVKLYRR